MPFYTKDWLLDTNVLSYSLEEKGAYHELLVYLWESNDATLPDDNKFIAKLLKISERKWKTLRAVLVTGSYAALKTNGDQIYQERLTREWLKARAIKDKRVEAGSLGGQQKASKTVANALANPEQNGSKTVANLEQNASSAVAVTSTQDTVHAQKKNKDLSLSRASASESPKTSRQWGKNVPAEIATLLDALDLMPGPAILIADVDELVILHTRGMEWLLIENTLKRTLERQKPIRYAVNTLKNMMAQGEVSLAPAIPKTQESRAAPPSALASVMGTPDSDPSMRESEKQIVLMAKLRGQELW